MAENTENIDLVIRVVDKNIDIKIPRRRSTDLVRKYLVFLTNAHLSRILETGSQSFVKDSSFVAFDPQGKYISHSNSLDDSDITKFYYFSPVEDTTRFCDFTAEQTSVTVYAQVDLNTPSLMARVRALEDEKENRQGGAAQSRLNPFLYPYIDSSHRIRYFKAAAANLIDRLTECV